MDEHGAPSKEMSTSVCETILTMTMNTVRHVWILDSDLDSDTESTDNTEPSTALTCEDECNELSDNLCIV